MSWLAKRKVSGEDLPAQNQREVTLLRIGNAFARMVVTPRFSTALLLAVLVVETAAFFLRASAKPLWCDELLTLHLSALQPFSRLWSALLAGADGMSPGYYVLVRIARILPGEPHLIIRLPSLLGYLLALTGIFLFARRRLPAAAGAIGVLMVALSPFREYAWEARCYAPLVGCLAMAAACWQRIGERRLMTLLFAAFLTVAVGSNHLAVVAIAAFGLAELSRTLLQRELRWAVWGCCLVATAPFLASLPILLQYHQDFGGNYWARPSWLTAVSTFGTYTGLAPLIALVLITYLALAGSSRLMRTLQRSRDVAHELVLVGGLLLYPVLLIVLVKVQGGGYAHRYGWPGAIGLVLGLLFLSRGFWRGPKSACLLAALLVAFTSQFARDLVELPRLGQVPVDERWNRLAEVIRDQPEIPVVMASIVRYVDAWQYAPADLRRRLMVVVDSDTAARLGGGDTADRSFPVLCKFVPMRFQYLESFKTTQERFIFHSGGFLDWMTSYLLENKYKMTLLAKIPRGDVYLVER